MISRFHSLATAVAFGMLLYGNPANANDTAWRQFEPPEGGTGAGICPIDDEETANFLCLTLSCTAGGPLQLVLSVAGGDLPDAPTTSVIVDGAEAGQIDWTRTPNTEFFEFAVPYDPERHAGLVQALRAGNAAELVIAGHTAPLRLPISLRGSSRAIGAVLQACPVARPVIRAADPTARAIAQLEKDCAGLNGSVSLAPDQPVGRARDLDGDGREDLEVNYGAIQCSVAASLNCGSAGCLTEVWRAMPEGDYALVYQSNLYELTPDAGGGFTLGLHGSYCGKAGFEACSKSYRFDTPTSVVER